MDLKTLREVCRSTEVSRRAVQGYEKAGLVKADSKNKYGHLLYDKSSQQRIKDIRFYQQIGFSLKEIAEVIDKDDKAKSEVLENKLRALKKEGEKLQQLIEETERLIEKLK